MTDTEPSVIASLAIIGDGSIPFDQVEREHNEGSALALLGHRFALARVRGDDAPLAAIAARPVLCTLRTSGEKSRFLTARAGSICIAQAILTPRGWDQSERFDKAWALVAATFHADVTVLANVIALKPESAPRKPRAKASR